MGSQGLPGLSVDADRSVAVGIAMTAPIWIQPTEKFALSGAWGQYEGRHALGLTGAMRLDQHTDLHAGVGLGEGGRNFGSRVGVRLGW
jgi:hypothetical protein